MTTTRQKKTKGVLDDNMVTATPSKKHQQRTKNRSQHNQQHNQQQYHISMNDDNTENVNFVTASSSSGRQRNDRSQERDDMPSPYTNQQHQQHEFRSFPAPSSKEGADNFYKADNWREEFNSPATLELIGKFSPTTASETIDTEPKGESISSEFSDPSTYGEEYYYYDDNGSLCFEDGKKVKKSESARQKNPAVAQEEITEADWDDRQAQSEVLDVFEAEGEELFESGEEDDIYEVDDDAGFIITGGDYMVSPLTVPDGYGDVDDEIFYKRATEENYHPHDTSRHPYNTNKHHKHQQGQNDISTPVQETDMRNINHHLQPISEELPQENVPNGAAAAGSIVQDEMYLSHSHSNSQMTVQDAVKHTTDIHKQIQQLRSNVVGKSNVRKNQDSSPSKNKTKTSPPGTTRNTKKVLHSLAKINNFVGNNNVDEDDDRRIKTIVSTEDLVSEKEVEVEVVEYGHRPEKDQRAKSSKHYSQTQKEDRNKNASNDHPIIEVSPDLNTFSLPSSHASQSSTQSSSSITLNKDSSETEQEEELSNMLQIESAKSNQSASRQEAQKRASTDLGSSVPSNTISSKNYFAEKLRKAFDEKRKKPSPPDTSTDIKEGHNHSRRKAGGGQLVTESKRDIAQKCASHIQGLIQGGVINENSYQALDLNALLVNFEVISDVNDLMQKDVQSKESLIKELSKRVPELESQLDDEKGNVKDITALTVNNKAEVEKLTSAQKEIEEDFEKKIKTSQTIMHKLVDKQKILEKEQEESKAKQVEQQREMKALVQENTMLEAKQKRQIEALLQEKKNLETRKQEQIEFLLEEKKMLEGEAQQNLRDKQNQIEELDREKSAVVENTEGKLGKKFEGRVKQQERQIEELISQSEKFQAELKDSHDTIASLERALTAQLSLQMEMKNLNGSTEEKLHLCEKEVHDIVLVNCAKEEILQQKLEEGMSKIHELEQDLDQFTRDQRMESQAVTRKLDGARSVYETLQIDQEQLLRDYELLKKENASLKKDLANEESNSEQELDRLRSTLNQERKIRQNLLDHNSNVVQEKSSETDFMSSHIIELESLLCKANGEISRCEKVAKEKVASHTEEICSLQSLLQIASEENEKVKDSLLSCELQNSQLVLESKDASAEATELKGRIDCVQNDLILLEKLKRGNLKAKKELEVVSSAKNSLEKDVNAIKKDLREKEDTNLKNKYELEDALAEKVSLERKLDEIRRQKIELEEAPKQRIFEDRLAIQDDNEVLRSDILRHDRVINELEGKLSISNDENGNLKDNLATTELRYVRLCTALETKLGHLQQSNNEIKKDLAVSDARLADLLENRDKMEHEVLEMKVKMNKMQDELELLEKLKRGNLRAKKEIEELISSNSSLEIQGTEFKALIDKMRKEIHLSDRRNSRLSESFEKRQALEKDLIELTKFSNSLKDKFVLLQQENDGLKENLETSESQNSILSDSLKDKVINERELRTESHNNTNSLENAENEINEMKQSMDKLRNELIFSDRRMFEKEERIVKIKTELEGTSAERKTLRIELHALNEKLCKSEEIGTKVENLTTLLEISEDNVASLKEMLENVQHKLAASESEVLQREQFLKMMEKNTDVIQVEKNTLQANMERLTEDLNDAKKENGRYCDIESELRLSEERLQSVNKELNFTQENAEKTADRMQNEVASTRNLLAQRQSEIEEVGTQLNQCLREKNELENEANKLAERLRGAEESAAHISELEALLRDYEGIISSKESLGKEFSSVKKRLSEAEAKAARVPGLEHLVQDYEDYIRTMKNETLAFKQKNLSMTENLNNDILCKDKVIAELKKEISMVKTDLEDLLECKHKTEKQLKKELGSLQGKMHKAEKSASYAKELEALSHDYEGMISQLKKETSDAQRKYQSSKAEMREISKEKEQTIIVMNEQLQFLDRAKSTSDQLKSKLKESQRTLENQNAKVKSLKATVKELEMQVREKCNNIDAKERDIRTKDSALDRNNKQNSDMRRNLDKAEKKSHTLEQEVTNLQHMLLDAEKVSSSAKHMIDDFVKVQDRNAILEDEVLLIKKRLRKSEEKFARTSEHVSQLEYEFSQSETAHVQSKKFNSMSQEKNKNLLESLKKELLKVTTERNELSIQIEKKEQYIDGSKTSLEELEHGLKNSLKKVQILEKELKIEKKTTNSQRSEMKKLSSIFDKKIGSTKKEAERQLRNQMESELRLYEEENNKLKTIMADLEHNNDVLHNEIVVLKEDLMNMNEKIGNSSSSEDALKKKYKDMELKYRTSYDKIRDRAKQAIAKRQELEKELKQNIKLLEKAGHALSKERSKPR